jgi:hypothetical protein
MNRIAALIAGGVVALVAAMASYVHMQELAHRAGQGWLSIMLPFSVDGLMVVASLAVVLARIQGRRPGPLAVLAILVGILVSLAANLAVAGDSLVDRLVSTWPPVAFALAYELVVDLAFRQPHQVHQEDHQEPGEAGEEPGVDLVTSEDARQEPLPQPTPAVDQEDDLASRIASIRQAASDAGERPPGRDVLARELGVTPHQVRTALGELMARGGEDRQGSGDDHQEPRQIAR